MYCINIKETTYIIFSNLCENKICKISTAKRNAESGSLKSFWLYFIAVFLTSEGNNGSRSIFSSFVGLPGIEPGEQLYKNCRADQAHNPLNLIQIMLIYIIRALNKIFFKLYFLSYFTKEIFAHSLNVLSYDILLIKPRLSSRSLVKCNCRL